MRFYDESYEGANVWAKVNWAPGTVGNIGIDYRFSEINDLVDKMRKDHEPNSIGKLVLINHGEPGHIDVGNEEELQRFSSEPELRQKLERLKGMLNNDAIVEIRICEVGKGAIGERNAQHLANILGYRVKVYEETVSPDGGRPLFSSDWKLQNHFESPKSKIYYPHN